jgi:hypothetical protein
VVETLRCKHIQENPENVNPNSSQLRGGVIFMWD